MSKVIKTKSTKNIPKSNWPSSGTLTPSQFEELRQLREESIATCARRYNMKIIHEGPYGRYVPADE